MSQVIAGSQLALEALNSRKERTAREFVSWDVNGVLRVARALVAGVNGFLEELDGVAFESEGDIVEAKAFEFVVPQDRA